MDRIRLVTFDIFGTLLDWQSYVEQAFPGRYQEFLRTSALLQMPDQNALPYRKLLAQVAAELGPRHARTSEGASFFADGFGYAPPFADARAVQLLSNMTMTGVISNCDVHHLLDVQRSLGTVFDVAVVAEQTRAYKPHAEAWDAAFDLVTRKLGFDRQSWLHVSAYGDFDLMPAKERGINTCFVPRPGGSTAADFEKLAPTYIVSDLWQLQALVARINGTPVRYSVRAKTRTPELAADFVTWMQTEHGPDLLHVRSCQQFQVFELSPCELSCEYVFTNQVALDEYFAKEADALRRKARERYSEADVTFERSVATIKASCRQRSRVDFAPRPLR